MLLQDFPTYKTHVDFIVQKGAVSIAGAPNEPEDWMRITSFKSNDGGADWHTKVWNMSPEDAKKLAILILNQYAPYTDLYVGGSAELIFERKPLP